MPQYQGVWNLAQQAQALTRQQWVTDPVFDQTTLLLQADNAANGAQNNTFLDSSNNSFAITRNGNTTQGSFSPFSATGWSNYFGETTSYIGASTAAAQFSTLDFEISFYSYREVAGGYLAGTGSATSGSWYIYGASGNSIAFWINGTVQLLTGTAPLNQWNKIQVIRTSGVVYLYVNDVLQSSAANLNNFTRANFAIGSFTQATNSAPAGYISNFKIIKDGVTVLDACRNNRFLDNSSTNVQFTITGTPSVQAFSPFAPQFQYTASGTGGSGYFDGTGDTLTLPAGSAFAPGTGDFTVDGWVYIPTSVTGTPTIWAQTVSGTNYFIVYADITNKYFSIVATASGGGTAINGTANLQLGAWNYFCVTRSSGTITVYSNGTSGTGVSNTINLSNTTYVPTIGQYTHSATAPFTGYISQLRYIKGTAISPSVPTSPSSAITNTQFLMLATNAGILDGTMKNNFETVADAKISTSVVKYGSGSLYFDGTGDYLIAPAGPQFDFGTGDFTIEFWTYPLTSGATTSFYEQWVNAVGSYVTGQIELQKNTSNQLVLYVSTGASANAILTTSNTLAANTWTHIAITRSNGLVRAFFNGVQDPTTLTLTTQAGLSNRTPTIGVELRSASLYYNGYIDDFRVTKGIARYTRNFTPPQVALPRQ